jgi:hypothetical protein
MKKPADSADPVSETASEIGKAIYLASLQAIRTEIDGLLDGTIISRGVPAVERVSLLARQASVIQAEERKAAAAEAKRLALITHSQVMAFLRALNPSERSQLLREALAIDSKVSVLA